MEQTLGAAPSPSYVVLTNGAVVALFPLALMLVSALKTAPRSSPARWPASALHGRISRAHWTDANGALALNTPR